MAKSKNQPSFWKKNGHKIIGYSTLAFSLLICVFLITMVSNSRNSSVSANDPTETVSEIHLLLKNTDLATVHAGSKSVKYPGNSLYIKDNGETIYSFDENVELKGRGNSTWAQNKKPYQIKFNTKTDLFNLGASKKWVLLADALDPTHMRNDIANYLARVLDMDFTRDGKYVNLYVDEEYIGFYYLTHKVEIGSATVNLKDDLGILLEMENLHGDPEDEIAFVSEGNQNYFVLSEAVSEDEILINAATALFERDYNLFEKAITAKNYEEIMRLIDVDSFVKYFLISEFSINPDAYSSSFYFYKDGPEDKIHTGPIWDFDYSFANERWNYDSNCDTLSPNVSLGTKSCFINNPQVSNIFYDLLEIPEFIDEVKKVFTEKMSGKSEDLMAYYDDRTNLIRESATADLAKWGTDSFEDEVLYLRNWLSARYAHFEETYGM